MARVDGFEDAEVESIPLVEVVDGALIDDEFYYGGGEGALSVTSSLTVDVMKFAQTWNVSVASLSATFPSETGLPDGGPYVFIRNYGTQSIQFKRSDGTNEFVLAAPGTALVVLVTEAGVKKWFAW